MKRQNAWMVALLAVGLAMTKSAVWADAASTKSVQAALDQLFPGWVTSENEKDLGPGLRQPPNANGACCTSLLTHPLRDGHATLSRELTLPSGLPLLKVKASADRRGGDWDFFAKVNGEVVAKQLVDGRHPVSLEVSLAKWSGQKVRLELVNAANGWNYENAYWHQIEIVDGRRMLKGPQLQGMKLGGHVGEMMDRHFANGVTKKDADQYAAVFDRSRLGKKPGWASEYWGKWLMSATPVWEYTGNAELKAKLDRTLAYILDNQCPDGYLGDSPLNVRYDQYNWDIWSQKYLILGFLEYHRVTGDQRVLKAACRLLDHLMGDVGPGKRDISLIGYHHGFASMGVLQATARLYMATGNQKYLEYSRYVAEQMEKGPRAVQLVSNALAGKLPSAYSYYHGGSVWQNSCKSYEMSTCYLGLLELFRAGEDAKFRQAVLNYADAVSRSEIMLTGTGNSYENWFRGAERQTFAPQCPHEGCTKATWMHLCRELLVSTGDSRWADEFEKSLLNGYLASFSPDGSRFRMYMQTFGRRGHDHFADQCGLPTHCCNEIGSHGFVDLLKSVALTDGDAVYVAQYLPGRFTLQRREGPVEIVEETDYPATGKVKITVNPAKPSRFAVKVRIPGWLGGVGGWRTYEREWKSGDTIELDWPMRLVAHYQNGQLAFTVGPILLSRDSRYQDGDLNEMVQLPGGREHRANLRVDPKPHPGRWLSYVLTLEGEDGITGFDDVKVRFRDIRFCDFASAANTWSPESRCRTWLPTVFYRPAGD